MPSTKTPTKPPTGKAFRTAAAFEAWMRKHHASADEIWLRVYKKHSGVESIAITEALDIALCWGWIDGIRKRFDEQSYLQRYTPRRAKSIWSQTNREHDARLTKAGRMTPHGQKQVDAAKADGRWARAYDGARTSVVPEDLQAALDAAPEARAFFGTISASNRYAVLWRIQTAVKPDTRARRIEQLDRKSTRLNSSH